jgi:hypothetical protein
VRPSGGVAGGLVLGLAAGAIVVACTRPMDPMAWQRSQDNKNEITALWTQIRDWRREAHMDVEPSPRDVLQMRGRTVDAAARSCPEAHPVPASCADVCSLADAICDNAETICAIAAELGPQDDFAKQKCDSAKASCREAKQRCCDCSGGGS